MTSLFNEKAVTKLLQNELATQLSQNQIQDLQYKIIISQITNYDGIKTLAKDMKTYLFSQNIDFQHGKILNILAKSYGFSNHHSMSAEFKQEEAIYETNTQLSKIFKAREEIFKYFDDNDLEFSILPLDDKDGNDTNYITLLYKPMIKEPEPFSISHEEYLISVDKFKSLKNKSKIDINKISNKYTIKANYNSFNLFNDQHNKYLLYDIEEYYPTIEYTKEEDIVPNFLSYLFLYGDANDLLFIEKFLKNPETDIVYDIKHNLSKKLKIRKYNKYKSQKDFMNLYSKNNNLQDILQELEILFELPMKIINIIDEDNIELEKIYEFTNKCCADFYNSENRYFKIQEELYYQIYFCETQYDAICLMNNPDKKENILVSYLAQIIENTILNIKEVCEKNNLKPKTI